MIPKISRVEGVKYSLFYERHPNTLFSSLATFLLFRGSSFRIFKNWHSSLNHE